MPQNETDLTEAGFLTESGFLTIGGIEQWVTVRGDGAKPVLLLVHGGPGDASSSLHECFGLLEEHFVLVQWDQRGAARTFGRHREATPEMTFERMVDDVLDLARQLRSRFGRKVLLLGVSWGSYLAIRAVQKDSSDLAGYLGAGQVISWGRVVVTQQPIALARAEAEGDQDAIRALTALGPAPYPDVPSYLEMWKWLEPSLAPTDRAWKARRPGVLAASMSAEELEDYRAGAQFSIDNLTELVFGMELNGLGTDFAIPLVFLHGSLDLGTPVVLAKEYLDSVTAPAKRLVVVEGAGHELPFTHPRDFLDALLEYARMAGSPPAVTEAPA